MKKLILPAVAALLASVPVRADDLSGAGRPIFTRHGDAVVSIRVVLEISVSMGGRSGEKEEQRLDITGTVVREDGLTAVSLAALDPAETLMKNLRRSSGGRAEVNMESNVKDVKIRRADGTEVAGRVILRDKDLDLAFLAPVEKGSGWSFVDLAAAGEGAVLDPVFVLHRLGQVAARAGAASVGRITAVVEKPRRYYVMDHDMASLAMGVPVFTSQGKVLGLVALRSAAGGDTSSMNALFAGSSTLGFIPVIRPADQVKEIADQADVTKPEAAPAPKAETSAPKAEKPADKPEKSPAQPADVPAAK